MSDTIELNKKERLFLVNQLEIIKNQKLIIELLKGSNESGDRYHYNNQIKALKEGFELHYDDVFDEISNGLSRKDCLFVLDVLEMYRGITYSFLALKRSNSLKELSEKDIKFEGFDLNTETEQFSYAKYFLFDLDRYDEIKDIAGKNYDFNSHTSFTIPRYKKQLKIWEEYNSLENRYKMTEDEIKKLLHAQ